MSYTNIPSQYIRTELTPANIKQALLQLYEAESDDTPIAGKDWLARYLETDDSCDTNIREDLFHHFFTLDLSVDYIGREESIIKVWTWKRIHGKDDGTKFNVDYTIEHGFNLYLQKKFYHFVYHYSKFTDWNVITVYVDEQTLLENIQEILYNRAASASTFYDQCE